MPGVILILLPSVLSIIVLVRLVFMLRITHKRIRALTKEVQDKLNFHKGGF